METRLAIGNRVADKKRALEKVIMPRQSRENTIEEKHRMSVESKEETLTIVKDRNANSKEKRCIFSR